MHSDIPPLPIYEIANAAIAYIELRLKTAELKEARANILRDSECSNCGKNAPDCYRQERLFFGLWCDRCKRAQVAHVEYRKSAAARTAALVKLKRVVVNRKIKVAA